VSSQGHKPRYSTEQTCSRPKNGGRCSEAGPGTETSTFPTSPSIRPSQARGRVTVDSERTAGDNMSSVLRLRVHPPSLGSQLPVTSLTGVTQVFKFKLLPVCTKPVAAPSESDKLKFNA
jgi:hypothetical protein